jgi:hypothetical protein
LNRERRTAPSKGAAAKPGKECPAERLDHYHLQNYTDRQPMTSGRKSNGGTTVALMSCGIKTATELLRARRWTTGRSTIYEIILRIPYRVKS